MELLRRLKLDQKHVFYWLTGSFTEEVSHLHAKISFMLLQTSILVSWAPPLHSEGYVLTCRGTSSWDYVPWAATSVPSSFFSVLKVGCSDPKMDLVKDGQKTSMKGVWREKESSSKGEHSSPRFQCTRSPSSAYILPTHRLISVPGSLAPCQWECEFWRFVQSAVRNCSWKERALHFLIRRVYVYMGFFPSWNNYNL